jgi:hypothetical protein
MKSVRVKLIADWQDIDVVFDNEVPDSDYIEDSDCVQGIWYNEEFIPLDIFARYGNAWVGSRPDCVDENGETVIVHGVSVDLSYPYFIEVDDASQQIRLWKEVDAWYSGGNADDSDN